MAFRWLMVGLSLPVAFLTGSARGGDCSQSSRYYSAAPQATYYAAPQATYYAAPQATYYAAPQATHYVAASQVATPVMLTAQTGTIGLSAQSSPNCAGASSQGAEAQSVLTQLLPLLLPKIIERIFPETPPAAPAPSDVNSRLDQIEDRLDRLERVVFEGKNNNGKNGLTPVPPPGAASTGELQTIIKGIAQIQSTQKNMAAHLTEMDASIKRNVNDMTKIQSFLLTKYEDEYKNHRPSTK